MATTKVLVKYLNVGDIVKIPRGYCSCSEKSLWIVKIVSKCGNLICYRNISDDNEIWINYKEGSYVLRRDL